MDKLPDNEIESRLAGIEGWSREGDAITKAFKNDDFVGSVRFVDSLVEPAEDMGHHPDLSISWDEVKVTITNHSAGGLTEADFELAKRIDALAAD
jgi:4a-hydroxytetrahydrobiopterin dehydratase